MTVRFTLRDYALRRDLATEKQPTVYYLHDYGSIVRVAGKGWFCTNDCRFSLVGETPNEKLAQPTLGPFKTAREACAQREAQKLERKPRQA